MKRLLALLLFASGALAQPVENVTVTGTRSREVIEHFVQSYAAPTRMTGKIARWETGVCPAVTGLPASFGHYIMERVTAVAQAAGAPVGHAGCSPNIQIVFTDKPQLLLDEIRAKAPDLLGYLDNAGQRDASATMALPIQAWYMTDTVDLRGQQFTDSSQHGGGLEIQVSPKLPPIVIPHAHPTAVTGSRLGDGLRSVFHHVLIVADPGKLKAYEMGSIGDAIAMLALSQRAAPACLELPSILNFLAPPDCGQKADALTDNDRAFLKGLYRMSPGRTLRTQEDEVAHQMQQSLEGK
jgi:hypothetical protein